MDVNNIKEALETFGGVKRRFNETNVANQVLVDDYAHHPREISATIETARKNIQIKILWQFSNHILSRTQAFLDEFATSLSKGPCLFM